MSDIDLLLSDPDDAAEADIKALDVVRRGMRLTPSIRKPIRATLLLSVGAAAGRLAIPILVQQVIDRGLLGDAGYRPRFVLTLGLITLALVVAIAVVTPMAEIMMVRGAQRSLRELRLQAFAHIHRLSLGDHNRAQSGALLARVTSDVESVARFFEWGAITWGINLLVISGSVVIMAVYSWQLTLIALGVMLAVVPLIRWLQVRQLREFRKVRTAVGGMLSTFNEVLTGSDAIRSYGYEDAAARRLDDAIDERYRADLGTSIYHATMFTVGDFIGAMAMVAVAVSAAEWGPGWGLTVGATVSFFFLLTLIQTPIGEITEVLDQTQRAVAGWDKVLGLLEQEPELGEPSDPVALPDGPLSIRATGLGAAYDDTVVLRNVGVEIAAGTRVAVVGETGSGKTTFARLLCRLIAPVAGRIELGGVDLETVGADERRRAVRLVPQDGFLFDTTVADNISYGRPGTDAAAVQRAVDDLGLRAWVESLPDGLQTRVGPRGELLSVGERQLVALARAQVADPGLLILDEATSSVDPETDVALTRALARVAEGRTVVSIAHRLSTAEHADLVLVFDAGNLVEVGRHADLVAAGGVYAGLYAGWRRATE